MQIHTGSTVSHRHSDVPRVRAEAGACGTAVVVTSTAAGVRTMVAKWVAHPLFDSGVMVLITLNCVQLAMYNPLEPEDSGLNLILADIDTGFTVAFTLELVLKMIGLGPLRYFQDGFNWLDFLCVAIGCACSPVASSSDAAATAAALRNCWGLRPLVYMTPQARFQ